VKRPPDSGRRRQVPRVCLISLGCPKNQVDSENLLGGVVDVGLVLCPDPADADVVVVNTCGFIQPARDECDQVIRDLVRLKRRRKNPLRRIAVVGCWVEREGAHLGHRYPEVDFWLGLLTPERLGGLVAWLADPASARVPDGPSYPAPVYEGDRPRIGFPHVAYLRICDGCLNHCSYCTIPFIRGPLRSKPMEEVVREARVFADQGVSELIVIGQEIANYGRDQGGTSRLAELIEVLDREVEVPWIRLMYLHPAHVDRRVLDALANSRRIVHYLDVPLQHISDPILQAMNRAITREQVEQLIGSLRAMWSDLVLRTTFIVGFPGETERQFDELEAFVRDQRFERLGCFAYCPEEGTPAAGLPGRVPEELAAHRYDRIMALQQDITFQHNRKQVGKKLPVIVDVPGDLVGEYVGRTYGDAPDIDGTILLTAASAEIPMGTVCPATVTHAEGYDLKGRIEAG